MKTKTLTSPKSSTKPIPKVTRGFFSANSPYWLKNCQQKLVRCRLRNHHLKTFQRWRVDSSALPISDDLKTVYENWVTVVSKSSTKPIPKVTFGFVSAHSTCWLRNSQRKLIRCRLRNRHGNHFHRSHVDSSALAASVDTEKVNENRVGVDGEIVNETNCKGDAWIHQRSQPLWTEK
jgi:hypothetical protein